MNQKGFIPIIYIIIGALIAASIAFGTVKHKEQLSANISLVFKGREIVISNLTEPQPEAELPLESETPAETVEAESEPKPQPQPKPQPEPLPEPLSEPLPEPAESFDSAPAGEPEPELPPEGGTPSDDGAPKILLPDYTITSPQIIPSAPIAGNILSFSIIVKNQGKAHSTTPSYTRLRIDISNNGSWDITAPDATTDSLAVENSEKELFKYIWAAAQGTHKYEFCADADFRIKESDESNNCVLKIFKVAQKEETIVDSTLEPDIVVQSTAFTPSSPINGALMTFYATVKNQAEGTAGSSVVRLNIDGIDTAQTATATLTSNKSETIIWKDIWKATIGVHALEICADTCASDACCSSSKFFVSKTASLPDYIIKSPSMIPSNPTAGETLSFSAAVYNQGNASSAGSSFTRLRIDMGNNGNWDIPAVDLPTDFLILNDKEIELFKNVWTAEQGTHKYEICADAESMIKESNETNNCISKIFTIP